MPIILGGGLSGLSAAYYLTKQRIQPITIAEGTKHLGGWIKSEIHDDKGFIFEAGPRTIRPKGLAAANTLELIEDLGLEHQIRPIYSDSPAARVRMIYARNKLHVLPSSLGGIMKKTSLFQKPLIRSILHDLTAPRSPQRLEDESIYSFVERRFGRDLAQYAISPMICGICAGDAKDISVRFLMNDLFEKEQKYGGIIKGLLMAAVKGERNPVDERLKNAANSKLARRAKEERWSIYSLEGGLERLPQELEATLKDSNVDIKRNAECKRVELHPGRAVVNIDGTECETDRVISSIPTHRLAGLVNHQHPSFAEMLRSIPYVSVALVNLQFDSADLLKQKAFGFLVPPSEKLPILGVIFDSCSFDMNEKTVLTVMMGGPWFDEHFGTKPSPDSILDIALKQIRDILQITEAPAASRVRILENCIPQYTVGHRGRVESIRNYIKVHKMPLAVCGAAYDGVGVNDVIYSARRAVESTGQC